MLKKDKRFDLNEKRLLMKKTKKYCFERSGSGDEKFLSSLDKLIKKSKKKMDADYAGDPDYKNIGQIVNVYEHLQDAEYLLSTQKMLLESEAFLKNRNMGGKDYFESY